MKTFLRIASLTLCCLLLAQSASAIKLATTSLDGKIANAQGFLLLLRDDGSVVRVDGRSVVDQADYNILASNCDGTVPIVKLEQHHDYVFGIRQDGSAVKCMVSGGNNQPYIDAFGPWATAQDTNNVGLHLLDTDSNDVPDNMESGVVDIFSMSYNSIALKSDGTLVGWGSTVSYLTDKVAAEHGRTNTQNLPDPNNDGIPDVGSISGAAAVLGEGAIFYNTDGAHFLISRDKDSGNFFYVPSAIDGTIPIKKVTTALNAFALLRDDNSLVFVGLNAKTFVDKFGGDTNNDGVADELFETVADYIPFWGGVIVKFLDGTYSKRTVDDVLTWINADTFSGSVALNEMYTNLVAGTITFADIDYYGWQLGTGGTTLFELSDGTLFLVGADYPYPAVGNDARYDDLNIIMKGLTDSGHTLVDYYSSANTQALIFSDGTFLMTGNVGADPTQWTAQSLKPVAFVDHLQGESSGGATLFVLMDDDSLWELGLVYDQVTFNVEKGKTNSKPVEFSELNNIKLSIGDEETKTEATTLTTTTFTTTTTTSTTFLDLTSNLCSIVIIVTYVDSGAEILIELDADSPSGSVDVEPGDITISTRALSCNDTAPPTFAGTSQTVTVGSTAVDVIVNMVQQVAPPNLDLSTIPPIFSFMTIIPSRVKIDEEFVLSALATRIGSQDVTNAHILFDEATTDFTSQGALAVSSGQDCTDANVDFTTDACCNGFDCSFTAKFASTVSSGLKTVTLSAVDRNTDTFSSSDANIRFSGLGSVDINGVFWAAPRVVPASLITSVGETEFAKVNIGDTVDVAFSVFDFDFGDATKSESISGTLAYASSQQVFDSGDGEVGLSTGDVEAICNSGSSYTLTFGAADVDSKSSVTTSVPFTTANAQSFGYVICTYAIALTDAQSLTGSGVVSIIVFSTSSGTTQTLPELYFQSPSALVASTGQTVDVEYVYKNFQSDEYGLVASIVASDDSSTSAQVKVLTDTSFTSFTFSFVYDSSLTYMLVLKDDVSSSTVLTANVVVSAPPTRRRRRGVAVAAAAPLADIGFNSETKKPVFRLRRAAANGISTLPINLAYDGSSLTASVDDPAFKFESRPPTVATFTPENNESSSVGGVSVVGVAVGAVTGFALIALVLFVVNRRRGKHTLSHNTLECGTLTKSVNPTHVIVSLDSIERNTNETFTVEELNDDNTTTTASITAHLV
eukprot:m.120001 g.120001  ORF g.120001 m.120001 type:complete len:1195 (+) comp9367_c0_seq2:30-3614(+)